MVSVSAYPRIYGGYTATASSLPSSSHLTIKGACSEITIYGGPGDADKLKMMADIFNDAFATPADRERETFTETERAAFDATDVEF